MMKQKNYSTDEDEQVDFNLTYTQLGSTYGADYMDLESRWKMLLMNRTPQGTGKTFGGARVGERLFPYRTSDWGGEDVGSDQVSDYFLVFIITIIASKILSSPRWWQFAGDRNILAVSLPSWDHVGHLS